MNSEPAFDYVRNIKDECFHLPFSLYVVKSSQICHPQFSMITILYSYGIVFWSQKRQVYYCFRLGYIFMYVKVCFCFLGISDFQNPLCKIWIFLQFISPHIDKYFWLDATFESVANANVLLLMVQHVGNVSWWKELMLVAHRFLKADRPDLVLFRTYLDSFSWFRSYGQRCILLFKQWLPAILNLLVVRTNHKPPWFSYFAVLFSTGWKGVRFPTDRNFPLSCDVNICTIGTVMIRFYK